MAYSRCYTRLILNNNVADTICVSPDSALFHLGLVAEGMPRSSVCHCETPCFVLSSRFDVFYNRRLVLAKLLLELNIVRETPLTAAAGESKACFITDCARPQEKQKTPVVGLILDEACRKAYTEGVSGRQN